MKFPIKPICEKKFVRKDGTSIVFIQYCFSRKQRTLLNTSIAIPPAYWNPKQGIVTSSLPEEFGNAADLNIQIQKMIRVAEDLVIFAEKNELDDVGTFVKNSFHPNFKLGSLNEKQKQIDGNNPKKNLDIFFQIDDYINSKIKKVCKDMPRIYRNMKDHLKEFEHFRKAPITFENLDLNFYEEFVDFLTYEYVQKRRKDKRVGLKTNTIGKTIKQFRTFLRNRIRKRIIPPIDLDGWDILEVEVDAVYLTPHEIKLIQDVDISRYPHLINYQKDFVLGCLTGLRFSDFSKLDINDLKGDMLYKKQQKSDHWVVIPLRPKAQEILKDRFSKNDSFPSNAEFNRHIKTLARLAGITNLIKHSYRAGNKDKVVVKPKYEWITSHTCRRSFCTNEFLAGTPVELIMKISGHKSIKDFYKYIRITPEEAGNKIKQIWKERGEMVN